jgi:hypothetical protein
VARALNPISEAEKDLVDQIRATSNRLFSLLGLLDQLQGPA